MIRNGDGDTVELVCIVHARPVPSVMWSKGGVAVDSPHVQEQYTGHRHSLRITQVMIVRVEWVGGRGLPTRAAAVHGPQTLPPHHPGNDSRGRVERITER